jgi:hypothetical protein
MHLFHVAVAAHQEYLKTFNPSESGPSPAQKYIKLAKVPLGRADAETTFAPEDGSFVFSNVLSIRDDSATS